MKFIHFRREDPRIDITPLVDVVFQLLIFFAVTTSFVNVGGLKVELPRSKQVEFIEKRDDIVIVLDKAGNMTVDGKPSSFKRLKGVFSSARKKNPMTMVVLRADKEVAHGTVVRIMDMAKRSGLNRIAIATEPESWKEEERE